MPLVSPRSAALLQLDRRTQLAHRVGRPGEGGLLLGVQIDLDDPLNPKVTSVLGHDEGIEHPVAVQIQFRYAFVCDEHKGLVVLDVTDLHQPRPIAGAAVPLAECHNVYVARTYAYVAAGHEGLAIVDVTNPERPVLEEVTEYVHFGFIVADAEAAYRRLAAMGASMLRLDVKERLEFSPPPPDGSFKVADPDGNVVDVTGNPAEWRT